MDTINKKKIRQFLDSLGNEFWLEGVIPKKNRIMGFKEFIEATGCLRFSKNTSKNPNADDNDRHISD